MKICPKCGTEKMLDDFHKNASKPDGRQSHCKDCVNSRLRALRKTTPKHNRKYRLKHDYGITVDEYERMLEEQDGVCRICGESCSSGQALSVDHDHETGKVRGLLCKRCNLALGQFQDDVDLLRHAIEYLNTQ